jgi:hypothetical protein
MIVGVNRAFVHDGREYHIQAEDLGTELGCFEVRVYDKGAVLWNKRLPYKDILEKHLPRLEQDEGEHGTSGRRHSRRASRACP